MDGPSSEGPAAVRRALVACSDPGAGSGFGADRKGVTRSA